MRGFARHIPNSAGSRRVLASELAAAEYAAPFSIGGPILVVPDLWNDEDKGAAEAVDFHLYAAGAAAMTVGHILGGLLVAQAIANDDVESIATSELTLTAHPYKHGDGPVQFTTTDTLPAGLSLLTDYYVAVKDANTIQVATSRANALNGTYVTITDGGTGTHTIVDVADTKRLRWQSVGFLGAADNGAHTFTADFGTSKRVPHRTGFFAYAVQATIDADNVSVEAEPVFVR